MSKDTKIRRRAIQKKVVSVPINDVDGLRFKGDPMSAPPSDSWSWRKYGQKPIKGSPYPRGYYRCSSSKGCPARKQVERSKEDPDMLLVTYSSEHNHPSPASKNTRHSHHVATTAATSSMSEEETFEDHELEEEERKPLISGPIPNQSDDHNELINSSQGKFVNNICDGPMINASEFGWFTDFEYYSSSCTLMLENTVLDEDYKVCTDTIFNIREEDEPFFADLGELPECAAVFRRAVAQREAEEVAV